jgi:acyl-CoA thioesterase-1
MTLSLNSAARAASPRRRSPPNAGWAGRLLRRLWLLAALALAAGPAAAKAPPVVTLLGDSITAGYGLPARDAQPARLQGALGRLGVAAVVRGAGVSGDTSADGLARVDFSVQPDTAVAVVALGGNDLLQGLDPRTTQANLAAIVQRLKARHMVVVLAGMNAPRAIGAGYAKDFDAVFPAVARRSGAILYPDLLAGVEQVAALNQGDGIHPNARGAEIVATRLAPAVARALKAAAARPGAR